MIFYHFIGMEPFEAFGLHAEPHAVTQKFVLFETDRNISWKKYRFIQCDNTNRGPKQI